MSSPLSPIRTSIEYSYITTAINQPVVAPSTTHPEPHPNIKVLAIKITFTFTSNSFPKLSKNHNTFTITNHPQPGTPPSDLPRISRTINQHGSKGLCLVTFRANIFNTSSRPSPQREFWIDVETETPPPRGLKYDTTILIEADLSHNTTAYA
ncbi:hypothetical protein V8E51_002778 [Hyaloscypha variabilis]